MNSPSAGDAPSSPAQPIPERRPPGPPPMGSNPFALLNYARIFREDPIGFVGGRFETYGDMYSTTFRGVPLYVTRHPAHIHETLVTRGQSFQKPETGFGARQLRRFLGTGLVTSNGDFWRRQRRMINPAFNRRRIEAFGDVMVEKAVAAMLGWRSGDVREIGHVMMSITLAIVAKTLFDADTSADQDRVSRALDAFRNSSSAATFLPDWVPLPSIRRTRQALLDVDQIVYGLIDERRKETDEALATRGDLLSALLLATEDGSSTAATGARMTRKELRDELLTLFLAGHETTSQALTWTFYLLSQHPEIEAEVQDELDRVLGGRLATAADDLPLVDRVIQESMRLYPPVTTVARAAIEDTEVGGWAIPKGADMICWIYHAHHDPRWWPDPERFDPNRFRPDRLATIPDGAFTPFGAGQRQCIGKHFSLMEARLILATILQRYRLRLVPGHRVERHVAVTMSPRYGMKMAVYPQRH